MLHKICRPWLPEQAVKLLDACHLMSRIVFHLNIPRLTLAQGHPVSVLILQADPQQSPLFNKSDSSKSILHLKKTSQKHLNRVRLISKKLPQTSQAWSARGPN